jgi:anaerobic magnesium-protoporphyrin IX monomethyl ester cyclase
MSDVLFVYPNTLEIPIHPEFDRYERLMFDFAEERDLIGLARGTVVPPTAMLSLSAYLRENSVTTSFTDLTLECFNGNTKEEVLITSLKKEDPKVVAVNGMEDCFLSDLYTTAQIVKEFDENISVVTGGVSATTRDFEILRNSTVDFVIRGEGETSLLALSNALLRDEKVEKIRGIAFRNDARIVRTDNPSFIDLTNLPLPDRDSYPLSALYSLNGGIDLIYASRGCSHNCAFCNAPAFWKREWRAREPKDVVEELSIIEELGAKIVHIYDLNFGFDKRWVEDICEGIRREKLDIFWDCELGLIDFTKSFLKTLYDGNCRGAFCGIETVSQSVLDSVNKGYKSHDLANYLSNAKDAGIHVDGGYVFGLPEDDVSGLKTMTRLACRLLEEELVETPAPFLFVPFKGTKIGDNLKSCGIDVVNNNTDDWHFFPPNPLASTKYASAEEVHREWVNCLTQIDNILERKLSG